MPRAPRRCCRALALLLALLAQAAGAEATELPEDATALFQTQVVVNRATRVTGQGLRCAGAASCEDDEEEWDDASALFQTQVDVSTKAEPTVVDGNFVLSDVFTL